MGVIADLQTTVAHLSGEVHLLKRQMAAVQEEQERPCLPWWRRMLSRSKPQKATTETQLPSGSGGFHTINS